MTTPTLRTLAEIEQSIQAHIKERQTISASIGALKELKRPLQAFLAIGTLTSEQLETWITRLGPEKTDSRRTEVQEVLDLIKATSDSIAQIAKFSDLPKAPAAPDLYVSCF